MKLNKKESSGGMVDISSKVATIRNAVAQATLGMSPQTFKVLIQKGSPKGNVFETARVAGIMAAKSTPAIIPLCHPLELNKASIDFKLDKKRSRVTIVAQVSYVGKTGVEMEALMAATVAALTIYDMMKWAQKSMKIADVKLISKTGGKSGDYHA